jgi:hypothetical protein
MNFTMNDPMPPLWLMYPYISRYNRVNWERILKKYEYR